MLTLYKVQKLSFIIKKGKGYTIHEKVQLSDDAIYMLHVFTSKVKIKVLSQLIQKQDQVISTHPTGCFLFKQLSISFYHSSVNQM